jgi:pimeloyl-ACP methyl ester carboxylesterase
LDSSASSSRSSPTERRFSVAGLTLAACEWACPEGRPVLAVHGWLDNAGSFDALIPRLAGCHVVALDCAGHGRSDFRSRDASYNIWQDLGDLIAVADQLRWSRFSVLGHSRGAGIAMLLAATFPERVERLVLIEGGIPEPGAAEDAPANLAQALRDRVALAAEAGRRFASYAEAIDERTRGVVAVTNAAAEVLARRSLQEVDGGFRWRADRRLKGRSELRLTHELLRAFVARVVAPTLFIEGEQSPLAQRAAYRALLPAFGALVRLSVPGGHYLHLEGSEAHIAPAITRFLAAD